MTTLQQIISKYGKPLNYDYPAKKYNKKEIYQILEEWLKQKRIYHYKNNKNSDEWLLVTDELLEELKEK